MTFGTSLNLFSVKVNASFGLEMVDTYWHRKQPLFYSRLTNKLEPWHNVYIIQP